MSANTRRNAAAGAGARVKIVRRAEALAAAAAATEEQVAPSFDSTFSSSTPFFFYHIIYPSTASLAVQVLGPNLAFKFTHSSALKRGIFSERAIEAALYKKTTGFLCLVPPPPPPSRTPSGSVLSCSHPRASRPSSGDGQQTQRKILAWAESGHGLGPAGDCLDVSSPCTLPNGIWTQRALHLSSLLGVQMGHPFDRLGLGGRVGMFRASHVEVKLATHAVHVLLRLYNITRPANPPPSSSARRTNAAAAAAAAAITLRDLARLKSKITRCSSPPSFEIYFSKKNCHACAAWVRKVRDVTGVQIRLCWRDRLVKIQYAASPGMGCAPLPSSSFLPPPCPVQDEASPDGRTAVVDLTDTPDSDDSHPGGGGREGGGEMEEDLSIGDGQFRPPIEENHVGDCRTGADVKVAARTKATTHPRPDNDAEDSCSGNDNANNDNDRIAQSKSRHHGDRHQSKITSKTGDSHPRLQRVDGSGEGGASASSSCSSASASE
ncbi:hypothetical protein AAL_07042 [Moelleriella libera RCEF 2490]|uniref:Uncharacterized protein n=1 Tax=Moelleriella libera RCEF 2490 TaxID=1081109 RepID=A0A167Y3I4_9HYPO|nr:hypothetical protein AAL_07042 [Moelleriella libera RCEF 2490]